MTTAHQTKLTKLIINSLLKARRAKNALYKYQTTQDLKDIIEQLKQALNLLEGDQYDS